MAEKIKVYVEESLTKNRGEFFITCEEEPIQGIVICKLDKLDFDEDNIGTTRLFERGENI